MAVVVTRLFVTYVHEAYATLFGPREPHGVVRAEMAYELLGQGLPEDVQAAVEFTLALRLLVETGDKSLQNTELGGVVRGMPPLSLPSGKRRSVPPKNFWARWASLRPGTKSPESPDIL